MLQTDVSYPFCVYIVTIRISILGLSCALHVPQLKYFCFISREHLGAYIERIPLDCEKKALKLIRLCDKYGFTEQSMSFVLLTCLNFYEPRLSGRVVLYEGDVCVTLVVFMIQCEI